jgi:DNA-binding NtrC family response regulator
VLLSSAVTSSAKEPARPARVLLAEDDTEMRRVLVWALRKAGYDVIEFHDGMEFADYLYASVLDGGARDLADLVVSDNRMPGASGLEILSGLREVGCKTPVILITAFGDPATHEEARRQGAAVIDKPFDLTRFIDAVRAALEPARAANVSGST